ncbi:MAG: hypothetical protein U0836_14930, partial [Pirellulales bacterium]
RALLQGVHGRFESLLRFGFEAGPRAPWPEVRSKMADFSKQNQTSLAEILSNAQRVRLRQIGRQQSGLRVFKDSEAIEALALNEEQKVQIQEIEDDMRAASGGGPDRKPWDRQHPSRKDEIAAFQRVSQLMSPAQQTRWQEYFGAIYEGSVMRGPPLKFDCPPEDLLKGGPPGPRPGPPPDRRD